MTKIQVKRINAGIYDISVNGKTFEVEQYPDGNWLTFERLEEGREYWRDYATLRAAKTDIMRWYAPAEAAVEARRLAAYEAANARHPLPISGTK